MARLARARLVARDGLPLAGKRTPADELTRSGFETRWLDEFVVPERDRPVDVAPAFPFPFFRWDEIVAAVGALRAGRPARYRPYDWAAGALGEAREVQPGRVVVEGCSSFAAGE